MRKLSVKNSVDRIMENNDASNSQQFVSPILKETVKKTQFQIDCEGAITLEELREELYKAIDEMWKK